MTYAIFTPGRGGGPGGYRAAVRAFVRTRRMQPLPDGAQALERQQLLRDEGLLMRQLPGTAQAAAGAADRTGGTAAAIAAPDVRPGACPFCGRIERSEFDYQDEWNVAFQPLNPVTPGHFLVVPREHTASASTSPLSAGRAVQFAAELARLMDLDDFNLITSAGTWATQTVFHLHVHIVPRREDDGLALPWTGQVTS